MSKLRGLGLHITASFVVLACLVAVMLSLPLTALGASPSPSRPASTDTRSPLEGPGFVGAPVAAILAVLGIAVLAVLVTLVYVRVCRAASRSEWASDSRGRPAGTGRPEDRGLERETGLEPATFSLEG